MILRTLPAAAAVLLLAACTSTGPASPPAAETSSTATRPTAAGTGPNSSPNSTGSTPSGTGCGPDTAACATLAALEKQFDARLGVYAVDVASGRAVTYRADERFAYCSTFKALAAGVLLSRTDPDDLRKQVTVPALVPHSPVTEKHAGGTIALGDATEAALRFSDNTAANIVLRELGGPSGFASGLRALGDQKSEPVRTEPTLNTATPGDTRDTSTPRTMAGDLRAYVLGSVLDSADRDRLVNWLSGNATGDTLIRAGVPKAWTVADKSGGGDYGTRNDIAVAWPSADHPIVVAVMSTRDSQSAPYDDALVARAATAVSAVLG